MDAVQAVDIARDSIWVLLLISAPVLIVALGVGLLISLFQALTQIQETTLTFVPKMIAIFVVLLLFLPFIGGQLNAFSERLAARITDVESSESSQP